MTITPHPMLLLALLVPALLAGADAPQTNGSSRQQPKQAQVSSGVMTGGVHPAVKDAQNRPITAGGFVDGAPVVFRDITREAGLDKFHERSGSAAKSLIIDAPGCGVALLDYDNDGW